jgi:uncharacterized membrane-anchored protein YhcB (DUF1043 family)
MDTVGIIAICVFVIVGLSFFAGKQQQKHESEMDKVEEELEARKKASENHEAVSNSSIDDVRNELRDNLKE